MKGNALTVKRVSENHHALKALLRSEPRGTDEIQHLAGLFHRVWVIHRFDVLRPFEMLTDALCGVLSHSEAACDPLIEARIKMTIDVIRVEGLDDLLRLYVIEDRVPISEDEGVADNLVTLLVSDDPARLRNLAEHGGVAFFEYQRDVVLFPVLEAELVAVGLNAANRVNVREVQYVLEPQCSHGSIPLIRISVRLPSRG